MNDSMHTPAHMFPCVWLLSATIHFGWESVILQDQMISLWSEILFFWDCSLMRHSNTPPNTCRVQSHSAPPPNRMVLHSIRPDADVLNAGYSLAIGCYPSPVSLFHSLWNRSMGIIQNQWENWHYEMQTDKADWKWNTTTATFPSGSTSLTAAV